ncbi:MAG: hypothetical protein JWQ21_3640 [Herminiimonas sp.]|nr:hypothetical protein [Herminiimonas sp.]
MNLKSKLVAIPLLASSTLVFASEAVPLSPADMDHITAGSWPIFENVAGSLSAALASVGSLNFGNAIPLRVGESQLIGQPNTDQLALLNKLNMLESAQAIQLNPGESVTIHQLSPNGPISIERNSPGNSISITSLKSGESAWIHYVASTGSSYTYVGNSSNISFRISN